uniref:Uncharacterized protein n=1 Tax=Arundo donax TaxID=35708 RepID=A0A0A8ZK42_ARUDO
MVNKVYKNHAFTLHRTNHALHRRLLLSCMRWKLIQFRRTSCTELRQAPVHPTLFHRYTAPCYIYVCIAH